MIHDLSMKIGNKLYKESNQELDVVAYGIEITIRTLIKFVTIICIGLLIHDLFLIIAALLSFSSLRLLSGGFHFSKFSYCYVTSMILLTSMAILAKMSEQLSLTFIKAGMLIGVICSISIVLFFGTNINPDRPSYNYKLLLKYVSIIFIILVYILNQYILDLNTSYAMAIQLGILLQTITLVKRKEEEEGND